MEFNQKLQQLRKEKGLTQEELAQKLFVSRTAISKWESGRGYPSIDSLRTIAEFFSVTVDNLISSSEALTVAKEEQKQRVSSFNDLIFGLVDLSFVMLLIMPLFANRSDGAINEVSLLLLNGAKLYIKICYFIFVIAIIAMGALTLALQNFELKSWERYKLKISLLINLLLTLIFVVSLQPYPATFSLILLVIKGCVLLKR